ncbi:MAG: serine/threonine-protein phosphatase, partial [Oscillospiraceae bacterium]|nr:serine/threonine-protein phosphatase [Oscillospiraceae bacterium]
TRDHSVVQELLDAGRLTEEQAMHHPNKNIITSALGVDTDAKIDIDTLRLQKGDILLLCSDGLSNMVSDSEMERLLRDTEFYSAARVLVDNAVQAGGFDNITAVLLQA